MPNVVVIGGGASGLMAAGTAAYYGANVTLLEKNSRTGRKILVTGKGRCNITSSLIHLLQMFLLIQDFYIVQLIILIAKIQ